MRLSEIASNSQLDLPLYICVPKGTLGHGDIKNCWVFDNYEAADKASHSDKSNVLLDQLRTDFYLPAYRTGNGLGVVLLMPATTFRSLPSWFEVLAVGPSEKSARAAAKTGKTKIPFVDPLCFQVWNSDPSYFDEDEE